MDDFITIRRRDNTAEPLLAPNQDVYLRENIRSRLLIAAQAVPRHQDEIYRQSVDTVSLCAPGLTPATPALNRFWRSLMTKPAERIDGYPGGAGKPAVAG